MAERRKRNEGKGAPAPKGADLVSTMRGAMPKAAKQGLQGPGTPTSQFQKDLGKGYLEFFNSMGGLPDHLPSLQDLVGMFMNPPEPSPVPSGRDVGMGLAALPFSLLGLHGESTPVRPRTTVDIPPAVKQRMAADYAGSKVAHDFTVPTPPESMAGAVAKPKPSAIKDALYSQTTHLYDKGFLSADDLETVHKLIEKAHPQKAVDAVSKFYDRYQSIPGFNDADMASEQLFPIPYEPPGANDFMVEVPEYSPDLSKWIEEPSSNLPDWSNIPAGSAEGYVAKDSKLSRLMQQHDAWKQLNPPAPPKLHDIPSPPTLGQFIKNDILKDGLKALKDAALWIPPEPQVPLQPILSGPTLGPWQGPRAPVNITDLHQLINDRASLFHITHPSSAKAIVQTGEIRPFGKAGPQLPSISYGKGTPQEILMGDYPTGVSMARVPDIGSKPGQVTFVMDPARVPKNIPLAEGGYRKVSSAGFPNSQFEFEQRTLGGRPVPVSAVKDVIVGKSALSQQPGLLDIFRKQLGIEPIVTAETPHAYRARLGQQRWETPYGPYKPTPLQLEMQRLRKGP